MPEMDNLRIQRRRPDADGNAQTTFTLGWTLGITTVRVSAEGIKSEAIFTATVILPENRVAADVNADAVVDIEDLVLVAANNRV